MKKIMLFLIIIIIVFYFIISNDNNTTNNLNNYNIENNIITEEKNNFDGKNIALFGDSLIAGYGNNDKGLDYYLKNFFTKANFQNVSMSGSTISDNTGEDEIVIKNQIKNITNNPDIIIFNGGVNDVIGYSLGFLFDTNKKEIGNAGNLESDTVITDFTETIQEAKSKFPNAKLYYVQMFSFDDELLNNLTQNNNEIINEIKERKNNFLNEVQKVCQIYDVEYIDVSNCIDGTGSKYRQNDWIHINEEGYKVITNILIEKINDFIK